MRTKALLTAHFMTANGGSKDSVKNTFDTFGEYAEILLPIKKKQGSIKDMTKEDFKAIKARLEKAKLEFEANKLKETKVK
jgi:hypothetical protein